MSFEVQDGEIYLVGADRDPGQRVALRIKQLQAAQSLVSVLIQLLEVLAGFMCFAFNSST